MTLLKFGRIQMIVASNWIDWLHQEEFERDREWKHNAIILQMSPFGGHFRGLYTAHMLKNLANS